MADRGEEPDAPPAPTQSGPAHDAQAAVSQPADDLPTGAPRDTPLEVDDAVPRTKSIDDYLLMLMLLLLVQ